MFGMVSAVESLGQINTEYTYKQYSEVDLKRPCVANGTWCSPTAFCSITVTAPDNSLILDNANMTNQISFHNITISGSQTSLTGMYKADMVCTDPNFYSLSGTDTFFYQVTPPGGTENNTTLFLIFSIGAFILLVLSFLFHNYIFSFIAGLLFIVTGLYSMIYGINNIANVYTQMVSVIVIGFGLIITIVSALEYLKEMSEGNSEISYSEAEDND